MLTELLSKVSLESSLLTRDEYRPLPKIDERHCWNNIDEEMARYTIAKAERFMQSGYPQLPATLFMDFYRTGVRENFQIAAYKRREAILATLVAECIENKGRFIDFLIDGIWFLCEESNWLTPANSPGRPDGSRELLPDINRAFIDLAASETGALMAWVYYFMKERLDAVTPVISKRMVIEVERRILAPYCAADDMRWMGLKREKREKKEKREASGEKRRKINNWNPWINSNVLAALLLMEHDQERRIALVKKILRSLNSFLEDYSNDGGCDEGPNYWNFGAGMLFDALDMLYIATEGKYSVFDNPLIGRLGRYIYCVHISGDRYVNFSDADPHLAIMGERLYRYGNRVADEKLAAMGAGIFVPKWQFNIGFRNVYCGLCTVVNFTKMRQRRCSAPHVGDVWLKDIQVAASRQLEGTDKGLYFAAKGGHNNEGHNHNDVGQFILYHDGLPVIIDPGVERYSSVTFGKNRYHYWTKQSSYHNLPEINGQMQMHGEEFCAYEVFRTINEKTSEFSLDIAKAYPDTACLMFWRRLMSLDRYEGSFSLTETFALTEPGDIVLNLMTVCPCDIAEGAVNLRMPQGRDIELRFPGDILTATCEAVKLTDEKLRRVWGQNELYRLRLAFSKTVSEGSLTLKFSPGNAASGLPDGLTFPRERFCPSCYETEA